MEPSGDILNIFLEMNVTDALQDHEGTFGIGDSLVINLSFAVVIDGLAGEEELTKLVERLEQAFSAYGKEIRAEKTKVVASNTSGINTKIKVNGQKLETVASFKCLGSVITDEGSKTEILSRIAQTTAALTRLKPIWNDRSIFLSSMIRPIQWPRYQRGSPCQHTAGNWTSRIPPDHREET